MFSPTLLSLVAALADPARRAAAASLLARDLGGEDLIVFIEDAEIGVLLPAPGFPQTLPHGQIWRAFLAACTATGPHHGLIPFPDAEAPRHAVGLKGADGTVLVRLGGAPDAAALHVVVSLLPVLAAALRGEQAAQAARAHARLAQEAATRAQSLAASLDGARRDLRNALRARDDFLSLAAHEPKTPVTSLRGHVQLLLRQLRAGKTPDRDRLYDTLQTLDHQTTRLAWLIRRLLDATTIEARDLVLEHADTDVSALVATVAAMMRPLAPHHTLVVEAPGPVPAWVDPLRLEQVVINLLDNAVKYSARGGDVTVAVAAPTPNTVSVTVRDRGTGIPTELQAHVFERFSQAQGRRSFGGLGLGLYISHQIVALHGGEITVQSAPGEGTCVVVTLPAGPAAPPAKP
ncbi:MAG: hypothetical protein NVSMB65_04710 [Chloroflexota bacterium]